MKKIFLFCTLSILALLSGCKQKPYTYEYLMLHPDVLQKEIPNCQLEMIVTPQCEVVRNASRDYGTVLTERENNPEQFGEHIIQAQVELEKIKAELIKAEHQPTAEFNKIKTEYENKKFNVQVMLKVVADTTMQ